MMKMVGGRLFSRCRGDWFYSVYLHPLNLTDETITMIMITTWMLIRYEKMKILVKRQRWFLAYVQRDDAWQFCTQINKQTWNKRDKKMVSSIRDDACELYVPSQLRTPTPLPSTQPTPLPPIVMMRRIKMWRGGHFWLQDTGQVTNRPGVGVVG